MRKPVVISLTAAAAAAAIAVPARAQAAVPCAPVPTSYDSAGAPTASSPNDPLLGKQWGLGQIKVAGAWSRGALGAGATIAIVDTGVDLNHPDLKDKLLPGADFVSDETCSPGAQDLNGHGTHVAGIAAAATNNGVGVAGTAPAARILPVRVLDSLGAGTTADISAGIRWAADHGAQVINLSLGNDIPLIDLSGLGSAVDYAWSRGAVIVAAAGNSTLPLCGFPAASAHAICVAATDSNGFPSSYSNFPLRLDGGVAVRAPGGDGLTCDGDVWSTYWPAAGGNDAEACPPKGYEPIAGTSMATPFVSGVAAMLRGAGLSNQQVLDCLKRTSSNGGSYDPIWGYGIVSAESAVAGCTQLAISGNPFRPGGASGQSEPGLPTTPPAQSGQGGVLGERGSSDTTPPRIKLSIPRKKTAHVARAGYITIRVGVSETSRVWIQVRNGRQTQAVARGAIVLATKLTTLKAGAPHDLRLELTRAGRRMVRMHRTLRVTMFAYAQDAAKNNGTALAEARIAR